MTLTCEAFDLSVTTQGPLYPPSEAMNADGDFVVVGRIPRQDGTLPWGSAIVSAATQAPPFNAPGNYDVVRWLDVEDAGSVDQLVLYTLPLPLPCNNYPMRFAPQQRPQAHSDTRPSFPLHKAPVPDLRDEDGRREQAPITLGRWLQGRGQLRVEVSADQRSARFELAVQKLVPNSVYTVMSLRQHDLRADDPTRPGPLGVPNVFVTDEHGNATYWACLQDPFPDPAKEGANRVINVVVLYMSSQMSYGGAIGWYGLGGDIHAHLKLPSAGFASFKTQG